MDRSTLHLQMTDDGHELEGLCLLVAEEFRREGIATSFTTGYDSAFFPDSFRDNPCVQKPVNFTTLVQSIRNNAHAAQQA